MAGKGDKARNCHTPKFRNNFDLIEWAEKNPKKNKKGSCKYRIKTVKYY